MCRNIYGLYMEEEIEEEDGDIEKTHGEICLLENDEAYCDRNEEKLRQMSAEMSRDIFKDVMGFAASCKENGGEEIEYGSIMWLFRLAACIFDSY